MTNKKLVPSLRFPEFKNSGDWEEKELGEMCDIISGVGFPLEYQGNKSGDYPFCKVSDISKATELNNGYLVSATNYINKDIANILKAKVLSKGTIIFAKIGEAIKLNRRAYLKVEALIDNNVAGIKFTNKENNNLFLFYFMHMVNFNHCISGVIPALNKSAISQINIPIPSISEQQKIADFLSSIDEIIALEKERLEKLQAYKKGLLQNLFPKDDEKVPSLRFPEFKGNWEEKKLGEIFDFKNGYTPSKQNKYYWERGTIPWFRMEDIRANGNILYNSIQHITEIAVKGNKLFPANSIILSTSATIGEFALIKCDFICNQRFVCLSLKDNTLDIIYCYYYMDKIAKWCKQNAHSSTFDAINTETLKQTTIKFPSLSEQQKIANLLSSIDEIIDLEKEKLERSEKLKEYRKGLLQQSFPEGD